MKNLHKQNVSLLVKWWWKLETQQGLLQDVIRAKYFRRVDVTSISSKFLDPPIWKAIMKVKPHYMVGREVMLRSGNITRLWHDSVNAGPPLKNSYADLFYICNNQDITVRDFKS